jgi:hypothetical protein
MAGRNKGPLLILLNLLTQPLVPTPNNLLPYEISGYRGDTDQHPDLPPRYRFRHVVGSPNSDASRDDQAQHQKSHLRPLERRGIVYPNELSTKFGDGVCGG